MSFFPHLPIEWIANRFLDDNTVTDIGYFFTVTDIGYFFRCAVIAPATLAMLYEQS